MIPRPFGIRVLGFLKTHGFLGAVEVFALSFFGALAAVGLVYYLWFVRGQFPLDLPPDNSLRKQLLRLAAAAALLYLAWLIVSYNGNS